VYFVPALVGLGAPHWEPAARGTIVGITRGTTRAHLARAALEAMAYSTADVLQLMRERAGVEFERLRVDGGATENAWLMQFQADVLGVPVERPDMAETTALGAAGLAGIAAGVWPSADAFLATRQFKCYVPGTGSEAARAGARGWARAVRAAISWARDAG
jgi:glycerol kinase